MAMGMELFALNDTVFVKFFPHIYIILEFPFGIPITYLGQSIQEWTK